MKCTITENKKNELLQRSEISGQIVFEGTTPSNVQLAEAIGKELKSTPELVVVKGVYTKFSRQEAVFQAVVYSSAEARKRFEVVTKHMKKQAEEQRKKAAEAAPEA